MPPEGPNKSEELLKRYAKERREQAPDLPLHPATRRLLQGEVTRQFGKKSALEKRGWSAWFGTMRGRLVFGTAFGAVVVTGVCIWWNDQKPPSMQMAKAEPSADETVLRSQPSGDAIKLNVEKEIAAVDGPSRARLEDEVRRRAPAAPAARAIRPDSQMTQPGNAFATTVATGQSTLALNDLATATNSSFSFKSSFERNFDKNGDLGASLAARPAEWALTTTAAPLAKMELGNDSLSSSVPRTLFGGTATFKSGTRETGLALAYNSPVAASGALLPSPSLPSVALTMADADRKDSSKISDPAKLAESLGAPARAGGYAGGPGQPASAPAVQPPVTTVPPLVALGGTAADKRQQGSGLAAQFGSQPVAQASTTPKPNEALTRYFSESDSVALKQKTLRELDRIDAEPAVLNRFEIEQQGTSVRVVDADGSVYEGVVEEPVVAEFDSELRETFEEKKDQLAREKPVALQSAIAPRTEDYSFRVSGSNVTLRQLVVVNGRFATGTNASARRAPAAIAGNLSSLSRSAPTSGSKTGISNRTNGGPRPVFGGKYGVATNQPATIEGTVRIGVTNQQWFRAVRDPR